MKTSLKTQLTNEYGTLINAGRLEKRNGGGVRGQRFRNHHDDERDDPNEKLTFERCDADFFSVQRAEFTNKRQKPGAPARVNTANRT